MKFSLKELRLAEQLLLIASSTTEDAQLCSKISAMMSCRINRKAEKAEAAAAAALDKDLL